MKRVIQSFASAAVVAAMLLASSPLLASPAMAGPAVAPAAQAQTAAPVEPEAGQWQTWLLKSGDQLRLPSPPNAAATQAELKQLKVLVAKRDAKALDQIAFWNTGAPAYRWNELFINESLGRLNTPMGGRALAILHAAIYDATIAAWDSKYAHARPRPSELDPSLTTAIPNPASPAYPAEHAVTAGAASVILTYLFPEGAQRFGAMANEAANAFVQAGVQYPSDAKAGLELGRKVGDLIVARAKADGSDAKWTGSVPTEPGHWTGENPVLPLMGTWKTWMLASGDELRPPPPPAYDSPQMLAELKAVQTFTRTPQTSGSALFWEYGAGGLRAYWFWNDQVGKKLFEYGLDDNPPRSARAYALTSIAFYDAGVACWDAKYTYWAIRPFQLDPNFKPLFTTPNHPSYPSAHGCFSGSAATALGYLFPRDAVALNTLAVQAGESRIWGGIHFRRDVDAGLKLGQDVAQKVIAHAKADGS